MDNHLNWSSLLFCRNVKRDYVHSTFCFTLNHSIGVDDIWSIWWFVFVVWDIFDNEMYLNKGKYLKLKVIMPVWINLPKTSTPRQVYGECAHLHLNCRVISSVAEPVEPKLFEDLEPEPKINLDKYFLQSVWRMLGRWKANF